MKLGERVADLVPDEEWVEVGRSEERDRLRERVEARLAEAIERRELERAAHPLVKTLMFERLETVVRVWEQALACIEP